MKELIKVLPAEYVIYAADSSNCPYGNRSRHEIIRLTQGMLAFLKHKGVKIVLIACNTISAAIQGLSISNIPILSIISPVVKHVGALGLQEVGLAATSFTVQEGIYSKLLSAANPQIRVYSRESAGLAGMIDRGGYI